MLIQFALTLTVLLGFCGLALDVGMMELTKLKLQNAADAAAMGAAFPWGTGDQAGAWQAAKADASLNGFADGINGASVPQPAQATMTPYSNNNLAVQVTVTQVVNPIFFLGSRTLAAQSVAIGQSGTICSYFLSKSANQPTLSGSNGNAGGNCSVYLGRNYSFSNGSSSGPLYSVVGFSRQSSGTVSPTAQFTQPTLTDPLASLPAYSTACDTYSNLTFKGGSAPSPGKTYCGNVTINDTVQLQPGTYSFSGSLTISNATVTGSNVMFYLTQHSGYPYGQLTISSSKVVLSAPSSGAYHGILIFADRSLPTETTSGQALLTFSYLVQNSTMDGLLYLPNQYLTASNSSLLGLKAFGIVADWMSFDSGNLTFALDYSSLGGNPLVGTPAIVQ